MKRIALTIAVAAGLLAGAAVCRAGSIWNKAQAERGTKATAAYHDDKATRIGDIITVVIGERSVVDNETTRSGDKASNRNITANGSVDLRELSQWLGKDGSDLTLPDISAESTAGNDFEGESTYETDRTITDRITVIVHDVLPNGNLVVMGSRTREVDGDTQVVQISGIVRPSDVSFDNMVLSEMIADFKMVMKVGGQERRWTNPGWLGTILNFLSPW